MKIAPLFLVVFMAMVFPETDACCSGCGCNIFGCNCDLCCGEGSCPGWSCSLEASTAEVTASVANCCNEKTVGSITYTLVPGLPDRDTHPTTAKDGCVYQKKGSPEEKFAFASGDLPVQCKDEAPVAVP